jgi:hypothetical protein
MDIKSKTLEQMFHLDKPLRVVGCASVCGCRITASDNSPLAPKPDESLSCLGGCCVGVLFCDGVKILEDTV